MDINYKIRYARKHSNLDFYFNSMAKWRNWSNTSLYGSKSGAATSLPTNYNSASNKGSDGSNSAYAWSSEDEISINNIYLIK